MTVAQSAASISWWGMAGSLVLVVIAVVVSVWRSLGLERDMAWAAARAAAQLAVVGVALAVVVEPGRPLVWSWLWVAGMVVFAAWTSKRRAPEVPGVLGLSAAAFVLAATASLGVLFGFGVFEISGRTVVPLSGMIIGNSIAATVLVGRRIVDDVRVRRDQVEARLALGMSPAEAAQPLVRDAIRTALIPQIETVKAVGIVVLPGSMVGLILAGASPRDAVKVQLAVMYLILGSVAVTTTVIAIGLRRRLFTPDERLVRLPSKPG
jgi:putative ABC transport system permease protein